MSPLSVNGSGETMLNESRNTGTEMNAVKSY